MAKNFRLYIKEPLAPGKTIILEEEQTHYLKNVVKYTAGDTFSCFDDESGEFSARITAFEKRHTRINILAQTEPFTRCPDIWLLFAPLKKDKTDFVIEKATELGCRKILPVITRHTNSGNVKTERYVAQSIEAAEQCRRTDLPEIVPAQKLEDVLSGWDSQRTLFFMDETRNCQDFFSVLKENPASKAAVLIGPEGGFSPEELNLLRNLPFARGAALGPRILRAETAVAAALSCWQMISGDWSDK